MSASKFSSSRSGTSQRKLQLKDSPAQGTDLHSKNSVFNSRFWIGGLVMAFIIFFVVQSMIDHKVSKTVSVPDQQIKSEQIQSSVSSPRDVSIALSSSPLAGSTTASIALNTEEEGNQVITDSSKDSDLLKTPSTADGIQNDRSLGNDDDYQAVTQDLESKIKDLEQKLTVLEKQKHQKKLIWYFFQKLQKALEGSQNFEQELQQYREVTYQNAEIQENLESLRLYARSGLPTTDHLIHSFKAVKNELYQILKQRLTGWSKLRLYLIPWIQIYKIKNEKMTLSSDLIQKLQKSVDFKDFDQVLEILSQVREEMPSILNDWQQQVLLYQQKTKKIQTLSDQTIFEIIHSAE